MSEAVSVAPGRGRAAALRFAGDDKLARLAAAGDQAAFGAIYRRYHRELHRYCQAILGSSEQADDALQNTIISALKSLPGETREIALKPWLFRVAYNESISLMRQRRPTVELDVELIEPDADVESRSEARERLQALLRDLDALPERQRGALVMRELSGLEYAEIAASFEFSEGAARQAIYEARGALVEMAEGRSMDCSLVKQEISANDRRVLRGRRIRAHLRDCASCREFETAIKERRHDFSQIAPIAPVAAAAILQSLFGGSSAGGAGALGTLGGGAGVAIGGPAVVKSAAAVLAVAAVGVGAADVGGLVDLNGSGSGGAVSSQEKTLDDTGSAPSTAGSGAAAPGETNAQSPGGRNQATGGQGQGGEKGHGPENGNAKGHGKDHGRGNANGQGNSNGHGNGSNAGGNGNGVGTTGTPPGQAQTPPGQAQTPPGQSGNSAAGTNNPNGTPPGQAQTPPGQTKTPPGQADASAPAPKPVKPTKPAKPPKTP